MELKPLKALQTMTQQNTGWWSSEVLSPVTNGDGRVAEGIQEFCRTSAPSLIGSCCKWKNCIVGDKQLQHSVGVCWVFLLIQQNFPSEHQSTAVFQPLLPGEAGTITCCFQTPPHTRSLSITLGSTPQRRLAPAGWPPSAQIGCELALSHPWQRPAGLLCVQPKRF